MISVSDACVLFTPPETLVKKSDISKKEAVVFCKLLDALLVVTLDATGVMVAGADGGKTVQLPPIAPMRRLTGFIVFDTLLVYIPRIFPSTKNRRLVPSSDTAIW